MNTSPSRSRSSAIIISNDKILLIHRKHHERGEYYVFPGGGIEEGETPEKALIREIYEEAGVSLINIRHFSANIHQNLEPEHYFFLADIKGSQEPVWQEVGKQTPDNKYKFEWVETCKLATTELLPRWMRNQIIKELTSG